MLIHLTLPNGDKWAVDPDTLDSIRPNNGLWTSRAHAVVHGPEGDQAVVETEAEIEALIGKAKATKENTMRGKHGLRMGMSSFHIERIPLKFGTYVNRKRMPGIPLRFGHVGVSAPPGGWGMLGNDTKGDCTMAGIAHGQMTWNWAVHGAITPFDTAGIVAQYMQLTGGADSGLDPVQVAEWWKTTGLMDSSGAVHTIRSYTAIDNTQNLAEAAYLFGFSGTGLWLPDSAMDQFEKGEVWDDTSLDPDQSEGHYVPLVGRNSRGHYMFVTWNRLQAATQEWLDKYFAGGVAYTSQSYMLATGLSPEGYDFAALDADLAGMGAG